MIISSWNVNSLKVRLEQVVTLLQEQSYTVLGLQELKLAPENFPLAAFEAIGYHAYWAGQKTYNGVALLSRAPLSDICINNPLFADEQQRIISATLEHPERGPIRIVNAYCPNGQALDSDKFTYKMAWYAALIEWIQSELKTYPQLVLMGDYNIAPEDRDVHDPQKWVGSILVSDAEREIFQQLLALGLHDSFRLFPQADKQFSWWDYRRFAFKRNAGLRIDHILVSDALQAHCQAADIFVDPRKHEQPSDHTPVTATFA